MVWHCAGISIETAGYCAGCRMADNRFMVSGGYDPQGVPSSKVEAYNPATFEWEPLADLPRPARDHKMCAVPGVDPLRALHPAAAAPCPGTTGYQLARCATLVSHA